VVRALAITPPECAHAPRRSGSTPANDRGA
jgi:hypothetical protein